MENKSSEYREKKSIAGKMIFVLTQLFALSGAWAMAAGGGFLRLFALGSITSALLLPLLYSIEAGMLAMVIFEPFRGVIRRAQYLIVPYSQYEPIHLITPVVTLIVLLILLSRRKLAILNQTPLAVPVSILAGIYAIQIFNPLQGGLSVGLVGAFYYLVPIAWFYFGQEVSATLVPRVAKTIVVLGIICSFYGVYQITYGYPEFELYWLENTDHYSSIAIYNVTRALATFSNAEEWGRYVQIGALIAFGLALVKSEANRRPVWFAGGLLLCVMLALSGQRSSVFGLLLGLAVLFVSGGSSLGKMATRTVVVAVLMVVFVFAPGGPIKEDLYDLDESNRFSAILGHTQKGTFSPTGEGSLFVRFDTWYRLITTEVPAKPLGSGLGMRTLATNRPSDKDRAAIDNHFLTIAVSAGAPAALLLLWILLRAFAHSFRMWTLSDPGSDPFVSYRIAMALVAMFVINNFFGTSFSIYSVAPLGWLLIGWISKQASESKP